MSEQSDEKDEGLKNSGTNYSKTPLKEKISTNLKQLYNDVVNEDIPDEFLALLEKADSQDK